VQMAPAPKKISAKVPMNSAISFCDVLYIENPPWKKGICARFERLHSSRNAAQSASLLREFEDFAVNGEGSQLSVFSFQ
jgi:hypothetical protein